MGRKRNQGKAQRAAKAKAREEADVRGNNNQTGNSPEQSLSAQRRQLQIREEKCTHGYDRHTISKELMRFVEAFNSSFRKAIRSGDRSFSQCFIDVRKATWTEFTHEWNDAAKLETAMSVFLCMGTDIILAIGQNRAEYIRYKYDDARIFASFVRLIEHHIAVNLKQTQALINWIKVEETRHADDHTLIKFLRHRIPCSCLDEKYEEVKHITKVVNCCNPQCSIPHRKVERSKTKYCSRCRCVTYCSRECQVADWSRHKASSCDTNAAIIAEFEAKRQK